MIVNYPLEPIYDRDVSMLKYFPKGVIVFDRDGTLVEDAGQHNRIDLLRFLPGVFEAIKILSDLGYGIAIASNQAGLQSRKFNLHELFDFNLSLRMGLKAQLNVDIDLIVVCPHIESTNCDCRKPKVGLLKAIKNSGLGELKLFVGNSETDRIAAIRFELEYLHADGSDLSELIFDWLGSNAFS
jgi:histidinol-phosphate phosphatase family protein